LIFFTADQHFFHDEVIRYCHRPWNKVGQMNHGIICRYKKIIQPDDTVYFVGYLTLKGPENKGSLVPIMKQLPGTKILILGNHDKLSPFTYIDLGFQSVHTSLQVEEFILCHDPASAIIKPDVTWICGHTHTLFKKIRNVINVGVDQWEYFPVSIEEVRMEVSR